MKDSCTENIGVHVATLPIITMNSALTASNPSKEMKYRHLMNVWEKVAHTKKMQQIGCLGTLTFLPKDRVFNANLNFVINPSADETLTFSNATKRFRLFFPRTGGLPRIRWADRREDALQVNTVDLVTYFEVTIDCLLPSGNHQGDHLGTMWIDRMSEKHRVRLYYASDFALPVIQ